MLFSKRFWRLLWLVAAAVACASGAPRAALAASSVAIVNLAHDQEKGAKLAQKARQELQSLEDFDALAAGALARALESPLSPRGPDASTLRAIRASMEEGKAAARQFRLRRARASLLGARSKVFTLAPTPELSSTLSEISFELALLHLREHEPDLAHRELVLLARLQPDRPALDPVRYPPNVVSADRRARRRADSAPPARLSIATTFDGARLYIDGRPAGNTPAELDLPSGPHLLSLRSSQHRPHHEIVVLAPGGARILEIEAQERSTIERAERMRHAALRGVGGADYEDAVTQAARELARLARCEAALVVLDGPRAPVLRLLPLRSAQLSFSVSDGASLPRLFALLRPVSSPTVLERPLAEKQRWYQKTWGIASIGGGAALTVAGILAWALSGDDAAPVSIGFEGVAPPDS